MKTAARFLALVALSACAAAVPTYRDTSAPITSIAAFSPERYAGTWYEIASYPSFFARGCRNTRATYELVAPGRISVVNRCERGGRTVRIDGTAEVTGPGRLRLDLEGVPFDADYWVLWVDEGYRTAVVGVPSGGSGFILNRDPMIPDDRLEAARRVLAFNGYDLEDLRMTEQAGR